MEFVVNEPESDQSIYVQQIGHGKFARITSTSLLLNVGALGPALRAGSPVTGSVTIRIRCDRLRCGVNTIRPFSMFASSGSPARMSSRRRSGPGRTTCPFVDTLVCMVRQSYPDHRNLARDGRACNRGFSLQAITWTMTPTPKQRPLMRRFQQLTKRTRKGMSTSAFLQGLVGAALE